MSVREADGPWRAVLGTDITATVEAIVQVVLDRWGIKQNVHDLRTSKGCGCVGSGRTWGP